MKRSLVQAGLLTGLCLTLALITLVLSGCNTLANLNIVSPTYSFREIRPHVNIALPLSASSIDFDMTVAVNNPNPVGLRLDRFDFSLFVNDSRLLDTVTDQRIRIPASGTGDVHLRARAGYQNVQSIWTEVVNLIQGGRARYELRGDAYYDTPIGQMRFPVTVYSTAR
ncbi:MAG TPA: LEA type 2 family protein [Thermoanaerobaculia bacterium]|nr:LEA type 2 family protein [Thermoanaerobaculia bacterium]